MDWVLPGHLIVGFSGDTNDAINAHTALYKRDFTPSTAWVIAAPRDISYFARVFEGLGPFNIQTQRRAYLGHLDPAAEKLDRVRYEVGAAVYREVTVFLGMAPIPAATLFEELFTANEISCALSSADTAPGALWSVRSGVCEDLLAPVSA